MGRNLVIAAIPNEDDHVWKISSEKIPHLTVLFLGDVDQVVNLEDIVLFVEHATNTTLKRFYLSVDHRGILGEDQADVVFFRSTGPSAKMIRDFRATLLKDNNIKTAYDSTPQFEGPWNPHLTLGYPVTPAKPDDRDFGIYEVGFDKLAVWTEDFDGPEFLLKDQWAEFEENMPMSAMIHATTVSDTPWSQFKDSDYTDEQYARACLLDRGESAGTAKQRYGIPVREPSGTLNRNACHAAAAVLSSTGGSGSARGHKVKGTPEQIAAARKKLVALYNGPLDEEVPKGLGGEMKQTVELGEEFLTHYGVKGMKWGVRNNTSGVGETKREGLQRHLDPQGHDLTTDVGKTAIGVIVPIVAPFTWPAQIRMVRGGIRGAKAKALDRQEKKFAKQAMSPKNFAAIHNGAQASINKSISSINQKYPGDLSKDPQKQKQYDGEVLKALQDGYRSSANSIGNKAQTQHLDVEFHNDGMDFKIHARQGAPTPQAKRVKHADEDLADIEITVEITGKIKRDTTGHIVGFEFDDFDTASAEHSLKLGEAFVLEHYGIKGMRWGVRREGAVTTQTHIDTGLLKRQTKVQTKGGEAHPATDDAIKAAVQKQKLKKSGAAALSNQELRELANRLQLESQVSMLTSKKGKRFVEKQAEEAGKQELQRGLRKAAPHVVKRARRGAATAATIAALA